MRSVMKHQFSMVPKANIPRSTFNRSHGYKTTFRAGYLVPFYVDEALPGDTFNLKVSTFARMVTPVVPLMDNMYMDFFFFAVPYRLVWKNWEKFNGQQDSPGDATDYTVPAFVTSDDRYSGFYVSPGSLWDYFGLPVADVEIPVVGKPTSEDVYISALPFFAYHLIWNEWFRDENLQKPIEIPNPDGDLDVGKDVGLRYLRYVTSAEGDPGIVYDGLMRRGKRHDYFTSCLPWPQKGDSVKLPMTGNAPVRLSIDGSNGPVLDPFFQQLSGGPPYSLSPYPSVLSSPTNPNVSAACVNVPPAVNAIFGTNPVSTGTLFYDPNGSLFADLSQVSAASINDLRQAFQIQKLLERDARGGTRYTELLRSHFGVISPDARLQRPEYLGGGSVPILINPVAQTSATVRNAEGDEVATPQGNLAAYAVCSSNGHGFIRSFTEHMILIGLVSVRADLTYQQNINRMWSRRTRFDFYWPAFSHLGEQAVLNKEIFYCRPGTKSDRPIPGPWNNNDVFGYQERWAEYRYYPSMITGRFRTPAMSHNSQDPVQPFGTTFNYWHLSQTLIFGDPGSSFRRGPALNAEFIQEDPPLDRVIAYPGAPSRPDEEPHFLFDAHFRIKCARPMPVYSVPGLIDHF